MLQVTALAENGGHRSLRAEQAVLCNYDKGQRTQSTDLGLGRARVLG